MGFNWEGAFSGLLAEGGRQATVEADRLTKIEEREYQEKMIARKEKAALQKEILLKKYGYDLNEALAVKKSQLRVEEDGIKSATDMEVFEEQQGILSMNKKEATDYEYGKKEGLERTKASLKKTTEDKPEYTPGKALKEIAAIDKTIASLNASSGMSESDYADLAEKFPGIAALVGGSGKEMDPEDKARVLQSLQEQRDYLQQFKPGGLVSNNTPSPGGNKSTDISAFIRKNS